MHGLHRVPARISKGQGAGPEKGLFSALLDFQKRHFLGTLSNQIAKLSNPVKDCNCRKVIFLDWMNNSRVCFNSTIFSFGSRSSIANVSNSMPRNVKISVVTLVYGAKNW
jgi:hypothetical protein